MPVRIKSILSMLLASASFAGMTLCVSMGCSRLPALESAFIRGLADSLFVLPILLFQKVKIPGKHWKELLLRGTIGTAGLFCIFNSLLMIPVAEATALFRSTALFVPFVARVFIKERIKPARIILAAVGFLGVLLILKPGHHSFSIGGIIALIGAILNALVFVTIRHLSERENPFLIAFAFFSSSAFYSLIIAGHTFIMPVGQEWFYLALVSLFGFIGQYFLTVAFALAPASVIAPWSYFEIVFSAVFGVIFLSQQPDAFSIIGTAILALSAILITRS